MKKSLNIICAGSSITWTGGLITGFVGGLDREIRFSGGHVFPGQVRHCGGAEYRHFKMFDSAGLLLSGPAVIWNSTSPATRSGSAS